jgi:flavodoxin
MNHVLYFSMTGNTKKMANAIARELGVEAKRIKTETAIPPEGVLFLGSGSYGDKPADEMLKFIADCDFAGRKVALFGTSARGQGKETEGMAAALKVKGALVLGSYYTKGKAFVVVNIGHPARDELEGARAFAREMARQPGQ